MNDIINEAIEAAARARHEKTEASAQEDAALVIARDKSGEGDLNWEWTTSSYEAHVQEEREVLEQGPISWEDASEDDREWARKHVRKAIEVAAPILLAHGWGEGYASGRSDVQDEIESGEPLEAENPYRN